eukprot:6194202-Pleurochrysis_carterae.AAC.2
MTTESRNMSALYAHYGSICGSESQSRAKGHAEGFLFWHDPHTPRTAVRLEAKSPTSPGCYESLRTAAARPPPLPSSRNHIRTQTCVSP